MKEKLTKKEEEELKNLLSCKTIKELLDKTEAKLNIMGIGSGKDTKKYLKYMQDDYFIELISKSNLEDITELVYYFLSGDNNKAKRILLSIPKSYWNKAFLENNHYELISFFQIVQKQLFAFVFFEKNFNLKIVEDKSQNLNNLIECYELVFFEKQINPNFKFKINTQLLLDKINAASVWQLSESIKKAEKISDILTKMMLKFFPYEKIIKQSGPDTEKITDILSVMCKLDKKPCNEIIDKHKEEIRTKYYIELSRDSDQMNSKRFVNLIYDCCPDLANYFFDITKQIKNIEKENGNDLIKFNSEKLSITLMEISKRDPLLFKKNIDEYSKTKKFKSIFDLDKMNEIKSSEKRLKHLIRVLDRMSSEKLNKNLIRLISLIIKKELKKIATIFNPSKEPEIDDFVDEEVEKRQNDIRNRFDENMKRSVEFYYKHTLEDREMIFDDSRQFYDEYAGLIQSEMQYSIRDIEKKKNNVIEETGYMHFDDDSFGDNIIALVDLITLKFSDKYSNNVPLFKYYRKMLKYIDSKKVND